MLRTERTEYGKAIRKQYEAGEIHEKIGNMRVLRPRTDGISNTITTLQKDNYVAEPTVEESEKYGIKVRNQATEFAGFDEVAGTLLARDYKGFGNQEMNAILENESDTETNKTRWRIRKLTTKCCWRLMGFTDSDHDRAAQYVSASALYKQAGNSICTCCLVAIFNSLFNNDSSDSYAAKLVDYSQS